MKFTLLSSAILSVFLWSCGPKNQSKSEEKVVNTTPTYQNKGHELVSKMIDKVGSYQDLLKKKDVVYTLTYQTPNGQTDIITEKHVFDGELSYGLYAQHEKTFPELKGSLEQGYDGTEYWAKNNDEVINDSKVLKRVAFSRPTSFYWFAMFQKLLDPGVNYELVGEETINETPYHIVKISFSSNDDKPKDIYQIYINKNTLLVDQFLFTVAEFGKMDTPNLMKLEYEEIDGMLLPTKRWYKKSTWNANVSDEPWVKVNWSNIKFNNNLSKEDFKK